MPQRFPRLLRIVFAMITSVFSAQAEEKPPTEFVIIDVRSRGEYEGDHVEGALHMEHRSIDKSIAGKVPDKAYRIYVYCASGMRSGSAKKTLEKMGYSNVINAGSIRGMRKKLQKLQAK